MTRQNTNTKAKRLAGRLSDGQTWRDEGGVRTGDTKWVCTDGNADMECGGATARDAAQAYVDSCDWGANTRSLAILVYCTPIVDGEPDDDRTSRLILIHPEEPDCTASEGHDWVAPSGDSRWAHGASISTLEVCSRCGMARHERGASQGEDTEHDHREIWYERSREAS
jgi:hypothetical protein